MTGKEIIDNIEKILAVQGSAVIRSLAVTFVNTVRKTVLREKSIRKFHSYQTVTHTNGLISGTDNKIKMPKTVECNNNKLTMFKSFDQAKSVIDDFAAEGTPLYYLKLGADIQLLPVPTTGTVKIYGEFWPNDIADNSTSDITTIELPEAWIYLGAAEYLDYFDEVKQGEFWRQKGQYIVAEYLKQDAKQNLYGVGLTYDPLGNGGV
jgi:hypothetical protein